MLRKHSITIRGHRTSFSIEDAFYRELLRLAKERGKSLAWLVTQIDAARPEDYSLSSALRLHVLEAIQDRK